MGCGCKSCLKILAGIVLILIGLGIFSFNPWLVIGVYLLLRGIAPMVCGCESSCCTGTKKK